MLRIIIFELAVSPLQREIACPDGSWTQADTSTPIVVCAEPKADWAFTLTEYFPGTAKQSGVTNAVMSLELRGWRLNSLGPGIAQGLSPLEPIMTDSRESPGLDATIFTRLVSQIQLVMPVLSGTSVTPAAKFAIARSIRNGIIFALFRPSLICIPFFSMRVCPALRDHTVRT